jgi:protein gp37
MGKDTKISWCDSTVNPVVGCDGCELHRAGDEHSICYAASLVGRYSGHRGWPASFDRPEFFAGRIEQACRWPNLTGQDRPEKPWLNGYPRTIFLGDLADIFSESLLPDWLAPFLPMMQRAPHIWIICTKRPAAARRFFETWGCPPNFWVLTTVTSAATLNRVEELLRITNAPVLGVSYEPALGPIAHAIAPYLAFDGCGRYLDWLICGGASGPKAPPMPSHWAFDLRDQCEATHTPFFFKQYSEWIDCGCEAFGKAHYGTPRHIRSDGTFWPVGEVPGDEDADVLTVVPAGVKTAGANLGGREWRQMPEVRR